MNYETTIETITVGELRDMWFDNDYEIEMATPDGWQPIVKWFDKGSLDCVKLTTVNGVTTTCAKNHFIETSSEGSWKAASDLVAGDLVLTRDMKWDEIATIEAIADPIPCYDFEIGHENHRYWGDDFSSHNSGKSFIVSGNMVRWCQANNVTVVLLDSEDAVDRSWAEALGVDTDADNIIRYPVSSPDDCATTINTLMEQYREDYADVPEDDRPKILFIIDSLGMLTTSTEQDQFEKGDMKGDFGRKAKALKHLVSQCIRIFSGFPVGMVCTNHVYASQDQFKPDDVISGGSGFIFASSIVVGLNKLKLKEDEDGSNKSSETRGIRSKARIIKSRYAKPFEEVEIFIPYTEKMSPYSGLFAMFEKSGVLKKTGNRYAYTATDGTVIAQFRKEWVSDHVGLQRIMDEYGDKEKDIPGGVGESLESPEDAMLEQLDKMHEEVAS